MCIDYKPKFQVYSWGNWEKEAHDAVDKGNTAGKVLNHNATKYRV